MFGLRSIKAARITIRNNITGITPNIDANIIKKGDAITISKRGLKPFINKIKTIKTIKTKEVPVSFSRRIRITGTIPIKILIKRSLILSKDIVLLDKNLERYKIVAILANSDG